MNAALDKLQSAWLALSRRERAVLALSACVLPLLLADAAVWYPHRVQAKALAAREEQLRVELQQIEAAARPAAAADEGPRRELQQLQQQLGEADEQLQALRRDMPSPESMVRTLRALTLSPGPLQVTGLRSLPAEPALASSPQAPPLYRHRFEVTLRGGYADIARQLQSLEAQWPMLRWSLMELDGRQHPQLTARLEVFTLSEEPTWIRL